MQVLSIVGRWDCWSWGRWPWTARSYMPPKIPVRRQIASGELFCSDAPVGTAQYLRCLTERNSTQMGRTE
jgi:hypothetical protein